MERRHRARGNDVGPGGRDRLDSAGHDPRELGQGHPARRFGQIGALADIRVDQGDVEVGTQGGKHQTGEATAATQVGQAADTAGQQRNELCRIQKVPEPDIYQSRSGNQIDRLLPALHGLNEDLEPIFRFT